MKQFVRYLYAYKNGKRIQNVGFVKCEESGTKAVLQIYGKGFPVNGNDMFELFVFYPEGDKCVGISMGTIKNTSPVFSYRLEYDVNDVAGQDIFGRIDGIILVKGQGSKKSWYAAGWKEEPLNVEQMIRKEELEELNDTTEETATMEDAEKEIVEEILVEEAAVAEDVMEMKSEPKEAVEKETVEESEEMVCVAEALCIEKSENDSQKDLIYKITRQDLAKLPRCEWKLANNHFLLHGYHNYHHLVSFEKEGTCWLGVPGVFHPNEQRVANAFGFDQFMRPDEGEIELLAEQKEDDEEFGYWCRAVSSVIEE